jgi:rSAM/selenodomain-associated transferase 2
LVEHTTENRSVDSSVLSVSTASPVRISVLIPALNEAAMLGPVLRHTAEVLAPDEIIVVDGGSTDGTPDVAAGRATVVRSTASRGSSLNDAARLATGDVLLFLHADTSVPDDARAEIARVLRDPRAVGGAFRFAFDQRSAAARAIAAWVNVRSRAFNVFLGDQALFVRKEIFLRAGGFRDWSLMEDLEILGRLRRFGHLRLARSSATTSARRHMRDGWIRTTATVWMVTWLHCAGVAPRTLAALYKRGSRRAATRAGSSR